MLCAEPCSHLKLIYESLFLLAVYRSSWALGGDWLKWENDMAGWPSTPPQNMECSFKQTAEIYLGHQQSCGQVIIHLHIWGGGIKYKGIYSNTKGDALNSQ